MKASQQAAIRESPNKYRDVKSKVAGCIKVRNKVNKKSRQSRNKDALGMSMTESNCADNNGSFYNQLFNKTINEALSVEQLGMNFYEKNSSWQRKTEINMKPRVEEVQTKEKEFVQLQDDLKKKSVRRDVTPKKEI